MRRRYSIVGTIIFLFVVVVYFFFPTDENLIRKTIAAGERAVMSEDIDRLMECVSYNYQDEYGNNYLLLRKRLMDMFRRMDTIEVQKELRRISIQEKRAEVELSVRVLAARASASARNTAERKYVLGDVSDGKTIHVFLEKSLQKWLITRVEGVID